MRKQKQSTRDNMDNNNFHYLDLKPNPSSPLAQYVYTAADLFLFADLESHDMGEKDSDEEDLSNIHPALRHFRRSCSISDPDGEVMESIEDTGWVPSSCEKERAQAQADEEDEPEEEGEERWQRAESPGPSPSPSPERYADPSSLSFSWPGQSSFDTTSTSYPPQYRHEPHPFSWGRMRFSALPAPPIPPLAATSVDQVAASALDLIDDTQDGEITPPRGRKRALTVGAQDQDKERPTKLLRMGYGGALGGQME